MPRSDMISGAWSRLRSPVLALFGLVVVAAGIAPLILRVGNPGIGLLKGVVIAAGILALALGIFGLRVFDAYRAGAAMLCTLVMMLICLEVGARLYLDHRERAGRVETTVTTAPYYRRQPWGAEFLREVDASRQQAIYEPYIIWSRRPFRGKTVNIDERGERVTPGSACGARSRTVLNFGGSTMWGVGSPDWATIPAYLEQGLQVAGGDPLCVRNLGEVGFVSTQEVIKLVGELRAGRVPDVVVFYDGVNDALTAFDSRRVGVPYGFDGVRTRMEDSALKQLVVRSALVQLIGQTKPRPNPPTQAELDSLAQGVVDNYLANVRLVGAMAREYGFQYEFFWQPIVFVGRSRPIGDEKVALTSVPDRLVRFYQDVYRRMEQVSGRDPHVHDIAQVFDTVPSQVYLDFAHLLPEGNEGVARRMLEDVAPALARKSTPAR